MEDKSRRKSLRDNLVYEKRLSEARDDPWTASSVEFVARERARPAFWGPSFFGAIGAASVLCGVVAVYFTSLLQAEQRSQEVLLSRQEVLQMELVEVRRELSERLDSAFQATNSATGSASDIATLLRNASQREQDIRELNERLEQVEAIIDEELLYSGTFILQMQLKLLGYDVQLSGVNDAATRDAVQSFQRANGLIADGIAGPDTVTSMLEQLRQIPSQNGNGNNQ